MAPEDDLAIRRLYAEYNHAIRLGDGEAWANCFVDEGVFSNSSRSVTGRPALAAYAADFSRAGNARYWIDNLVLEATPEGASGTCYLILFHVGERGAQPQIQLTGVYSDTLVHEDGAWRFARRHIARDV